MLLAVIVAIILSFSVEAAIPVHFEPSTEPTFDYVARTGRYSLQVNSGQARFQTPQGHAITMQLAGARRVAPGAPERLPGVSHYYLGADAAQWRVNVPQYSRVRWRQVYRGIDLVYYGNGREIEFDFEVGAGVNAGQIRLQFAGANGIRINEDGALELSTPSGTLLKRAPVAYQVIQGKRRNVGVRYEVEGTEVRFALGSYDRGRPLVIDPSVAYSTYLGGDGIDTPTALGVDIYGSAYVAGTTNSTFFPGAGLKPGGSEVGFLTKVSPAGNSIVYSIYINGAPGAIAVDSNGTVYLSGHSAGGLAVKNAFQAAPAGLSDAFVAKFQPDGSLGFATYLGGSGEENGSTRGGVRFDSTGAVYVAGSTRSSNFPVNSFPIKSFGLL